ncbi:glycosyltransferase family 4 protein [Bdellovibrio sp. GT3]|uniref:glycosyltransferase family 4 protein n=1 Tax=Bdellovibrio sp. GT3 TaxID=3136282 RepID=UPI0030F236D1
MKTNLWYITKYFAPQTASSFGGRGHSLMKELAKLEYNVTVISSDSNNLCEIPSFVGKSHSEKKHGYRLIFLKTLKYTTAKSIKRILSWLHFEWNLFTFKTQDLPKPDVVIVSSLSLLTIFYGFHLKNKFGAKLIFEVRDIWPLTIIEEGGFSKNNPFVFLLGIVERLAYKNSDYIIGTMPNLLDHVESVTKNHPPVACIPMGIDKDIADDSIPLTENYKLTYFDKKYFNFVYAGTVGITNALEPFLNAAKGMQSEKELRFIVIGDGALRQEYMRKYDLPNLIFAPKIPRNMVQSALAQADLLYFSTHNSKVWNFGLSLNKLIDYMRAGKPIIASYSGYPSMVNEANCGEFIPAHDTQAVVKTISKYMQMPKEERLAIGSRGNKWIYENRTYTVLANDYNEIIKNLLHTH